MKNSILLLVCGLFFYTSNAQTSTALTQVSKKGYLGATIGVSLPTGNFADTDFENEQAGLANTGPCYSLSFAYRLGVNVGLAAEYKHSSNPIDGDALTEALLHFQGLYWKTDGGNWLTNWALGGLYASFSKNDRSAFTIKCLLGPVSGTFPEITLTNGPNWVKQSSDNASGLGFMLGCGLKSNISDNLCFLAGIDFVHTALDFELTTSNSVGYEMKTDYTQYISAALLSIGLAVRI